MLRGYYIRRARKLPIQLGHIDKMYFENIFAELRPEFEMKPLARDLRNALFLIDGVPLRGLFAVPE